MSTLSTTDYFHWSNGMPCTLTGIVGADMHNDNIDRAKDSCYLEEQPVDTSLTTTSKLNRNTYSVQKTTANLSASE